MRQPTRGRGRPTEQTAQVSAMTFVRLVPEELDALKRAAAAEGVPVSRLLRRAVREIVNGAPDLFDDDLQALRDVSKELAAIGRNLNQLTASVNSGEHAHASDLIASLKDVRAGVEEARIRYARLIQASRQRWVSIRGDASRGRAKDVATDSYEEVRPGSSR